MPLITYDTEFATLVLQLITNLVRAIGGLLKSIVSSDNIADISASIWGIIYWLIKDLNGLVDLVGASNVSINLANFTSLNFVPVVEFAVGPTDASSGITFILNKTGEVIASDTSLGSGVVYHVVYLLSFIPEFIVQLMNALPTALPWG